MQPEKRSAAKHPVNSTGAGAPPKSLWPDLFSPGQGCSRTANVRDLSRFEPLRDEAASVSAASTSAMRSLIDWLNAISRRLLPAREPRRLRLCETLSLGNRGYVAVVRYRDQQFLVGGTNHSIALLAQLSHPPAFTGTIGNAASGESEAPARE